jgi:hypothetical protein
VWLDGKLVGNRLGEEGRRRGDLGLATEKYQCELSYSKCKRKNEVDDRHTVMDQPYDSAYLSIITLTS